LEPFNYLRVLRRRWYYVLLGLLVGAVAGYATAPGEGRRPVRFEATATLIVNPDAVTNAPGGDNRNTLLPQLHLGELLVTTGDVPERAAARLGASDAAALAENIRAVADDDTRSLRVTATASSAGRASELANTFSDELLAALAETSAASYKADLDSAGAQVTSLRTLLLDLEAQLAAQLAALPADDPRAGTPNDPRAGTLDAERSTVAGRYQLALEALQKLQIDGAPPATLDILEPGVGEVAPATGIRMPDGKSTRGALLGAFGLLLGIGGAFAGNRLDLRIKDEHDVETAFGVPVIAEIPPLPGRLANSRELFAVTQPALPFVESYRALRTVVLFVSTGLDGDGASAEHRHPGPGDDHGTGKGKVILITSAGPNEGKSTTAAHLAVVLAEAGRSVLVVGGDLRRPRLHELFDVPNEPGFTDILAEGSDVRLSDLKLATGIEGLWLLPSGPPVANPARLIQSAVHVLNAARRLFDFVIVDTPPLLVANDTTELAVAADHVILLARADWTTRVAARRAAEVLERVEAPVLGAVLIAAHDTPSAYSYYRTGYYDEPEGTTKKKRWRGARTAVEPTSTAEPGAEVPADRQEPADIAGHIAAP